MCYFFFIFVNTLSIVQFSAAQDAGSVPVVFCALACNLVSKYDYFRKHRNESKMVADIECKHISRNPIQSTMK